MNMFCEDRFLAAVGVVGIAAFTGVTCYKLGKGVGYIKGVVDVYNGLTEDWMKRKNRRNNANYRYYTD